MTERLQKFLSRAGVASRRAAEQLIVDGKVKVNNQVITTLGSRVDPEKDLVTVEGQPVELSSQRKYFLLYKPPSVITTMSDPQGRATVADYTAIIGSRVFPVGRLDFDAEGALLLTDDGELANKLMHPSHEVPRVYLAKVKGTPDAASLQKLVEGVRLEDGMAHATEAVVFDHAEKNTWVKLVVTEGRQHLVKRLCAAIGHPVVRLFRPAHAGVPVTGLKPGELRPLSTLELERVKALAEGATFPEPPLALPARRHGHGAAGLEDSDDAPPARAGRGPKRDFGGGKGARFDAGSKRGAGGRDRGPRRSEGGARSFGGGGESAEGAPRRFARGEGGTGGTRRFGRGAEGGQGAPRRFSGPAEGGGGAEGPRRFGGRGEGAEGGSRRAGGGGAGARRFGAGGEGAEGPRRFGGRREGGEGGPRRFSGGGEDGPRRFGGRGEGGEGGPRRFSGGGEEGPRRFGGRGEGGQGGPRRFAGGAEGEDAPRRFGRGGEGGEGGPRRGGRAAEGGGARFGSRDGGGRGGAGGDGGPRRFGNRSEGGEGGARRFGGTGDGGERGARPAGPRRFGSGEGAGGRRSGPGRFGAGGERGFGGAGRSGGERRVKTGRRFDGGKPGGGGGGPRGPGRGGSRGKPRGS